MIRKASVDLTWFKSSYSDGTDGESCVEVALNCRFKNPPWGLWQSLHCTNPSFTR